MTQNYSLIHKHHIKGKTVIQKGVPKTKIYNMYFQKVLCKSILLVYKPTFDKDYTRN